MARPSKLTILQKWPGQSHARNWAFQIDDQIIPAPAKQVEILAYLYRNLGTVVPYARLLSILGHGHRKDRNLLRQYMNRINEMLTACDVPYVITVTHNVGYALCRVSSRSDRV